MKIERTQQWWLERVDREQDFAVSAGFAARDPVQEDQPLHFFHPGDNVKTVAEIAKRLGEISAYLEQYDGGLDALEIVLISNELGNIGHDLAVIHDHAHVERREAEKQK